MSEREQRKASLQPFVDCFGRSIEEVLNDLEQFCVTLEKWQRMQNLVSRETLGAVWERHILDSLQILPLMHDHLAANSASTLVDIGSGGGFPALPLAIALKGSPITLHMVESRSRKCAFLKAVVRESGLSAHVHTSRIEDVDRTKLEPIHAMTARALAPLPLLFGYLEHFWTQDITKAYLHKGREYGEELRQADSVWRSSVINHPSTVDPQGVILEVSSLERIA